MTSPHRTQNNPASLRLAFVLYSCFFNRLWPLDYFKRSIFKQVKAICDFIQFNSYKFELVYLYLGNKNHNHVVESSLGYYINPLFNVLLDVVVLRERLNSWQLVSLLMAFIGVSVITVQYGKIPWIAISLTLTFGLYGLVKKLTNLDSITGLVLETLIVAPLALYYVISKQAGRA